MALALWGCATEVAPEQQPAAGGSTSAVHLYGYATLEGLNVPQTRGVADLSKVWTHAMATTNLTVKFLNGSEAYQEFVKEVASEWEKVADVHFHFLDDSAEDAMVRIQFDNGMSSSWSLTGTDHMQVWSDQDQPTMHFARWSRASEAVRRSDVLRAFGQVLGLELEYRHPSFYPEWLVDESGNIDEEYIREYWEIELNEVIPWNELKTMVLDPLESQTQFVQATTAYDPESVMVWPFYEQLANNLPPVEDEMDYNTELSQQDKAFVAMLYGGYKGDVCVEDLVPLISFDFSGRTLDMRLTGTKDLAVVWEGSDMAVNTLYRYEGDGTNGYDFVVNHTYAAAASRRVVVCEVLPHGHGTVPQESTAVGKFDLRSGNLAGNFDFGKEVNRSLTYIRVVGGADFEPQTFAFDGYANLVELYLNQIGESEIVVSNCPNLETLATSTHIYGYSAWGRDDENPVQPYVLGGDEIEQVTQWPDLPETQYSLSGNSEASGLSIVNCPKLSKLSLENTHITTLDLHNLGGLEFVYLSSTAPYIVCGNRGLSMLGKNLYDTVCTLPSRVGQKTGTVYVRYIDGTAYGRLPINEGIYSSIGQFVIANNWQMEIPQGVTLYGGAE